MKRNPGTVTQSIQDKAQNQRNWCAHQTILRCGAAEIKADVEAPLGVRTETRGKTSRDKKSSRKSKSKGKDEKKSKSSKSKNKSSKTR